MILLPEENIPFFPHPFLANEDGILAVGGNLNPSTLIQAYSAGIFPWFNEGDPIIWWFTSPRCVLFPKKIKISKSMRKWMADTQYTIRWNHRFKEVVFQCQNITRQGQSDTWITNQMIDAYYKLHKTGFAHSVEVYDDEKLVGGLYGVCIGKVFYGESMFSKESNVSKYALINLCVALEAQDFLVIDCQQETKHLISMGAEMISKDQFWTILSQNRSYKRKTDFSTK